MQKSERVGSSGVTPRELIGRPSRSPDLDVLPGFKSPPPGYGEVGFYWWVGDPLTKERILWQLDQLAQAGSGITALQVNYAHSDKGGPTWGLTYESEPPIFSPAWWELFGWFLEQARARGMSVSLSDYTLGIGQGHLIDEALAANPQICATVLHHEVREVQAGAVLRWELPGEPLSLVALVTVPGEETADVVVLSKYVTGRVLEWAAPGAARVVAVWSERRSPSIDPSHPDSGRAVADHFFGAFERRFPDQCGKGLNFFFSDELEFNLGRRKVWSEYLRNEFIRLKGYDLQPALHGLFVDIGPITPKLRLDYNDVFVRLSEENYFKPVFDWHEQRGMIYGCDHGGRGRDVIEFGDYFRTQKWNQGVGCDQPHLGRDLIKNKVAASIAHLYERPRVWLEGFYSSGWGTSSAQVWDAIAANFLHGHNLLTLHGLYYTTHGGWWEWAPPCNHFRMPYWKHMPHLLAASERMSYLLSQGHHVCDVAVVYPVAAMEADGATEEGRRAVDTAFGFAEELYAAGHDFDFIDFESVERCEIRDGRLNVVGESYSVLVLPAMTTIRHSTLRQATAFAQAGGMVVAIGELPVASDRLGRGDPEIRAMVEAIFQLGLGGVHVGSVSEAVEYLSGRLVPGVRVESGKPPLQFLHRRAGQRDVFGLLGVSEGSVAAFRATGQPERWDPWTGQTVPLPVLSQEKGVTRVRLDADSRELQLIVFTPGSVPPAATPEPTARSSTHIELNQEWQCELVPTLDNTWGDYYWPPTPGLLGAEAREFGYLGVDDDSIPVAREWQTVRAGFGPKFLQRSVLGSPLSPREEMELAARSVPPAGPWHEYQFSFIRGDPTDPGHQGYHGLKEEMHADFIRLGRFVYDHPSTRREADPAGAVTYLWTTVYSPHETQAVFAVGADKSLQPAVAYLISEPIKPGAVRLRAGNNPVLLRYDSHGTGYAVFLGHDAKPPAKLTTIGTLRGPWADHLGLLPFDTRPHEGSPQGWYRVSAPPGATALLLPAISGMRAFLDGAELKVSSLPKGQARIDLPAPSLRGATVYLRIPHSRGVYGGEAISAPIRFETTAGLISAGDWSDIPGLRFYSGGMRYRTTLRLSSDQLSDARQIRLDLGEVVASAEVLVNGSSAGVRLSPPWTFDLTHLVRNGENTVEVLVYSALAGHYRSIPTRYRGTELRSGLIGPVHLDIN